MSCLVALQSHYTCIRPPAGSGLQFQSHSISDDEIVRCLKSRGSLRGGFVEFALINCSAGIPLCKRLHKECGIPVVVGWSGDVLPGQRTLMVRSVSECNGAWC